MSELIVSRRRFLAGAAGLVVAAACSDGGGDTAATTTTELEGLSGSPASSDLYAGAEQRFAFGLFRNQKGGDAEPVLGDPVRLQLVAPGGTKGAVLTPTFHGDGLGGDRGVYVLHTTFDRPGFWTVRVKSEADSGTFAVEVGRTPGVVPVGGQAISSPSPTTADPLGVNPICTREPACPLHEISLDAALAAGGPLVVNFGTPARCESRMCGPVLDILLEELGSFPGLRAIHVEIYRDPTTTDLVPTVEAWQLQTEPWLFGIDGQGRVVDRLDGAFDRAEVRELLGRLGA